MGDDGSAHQAPEDADDRRAKHGKADHFQSLADRRGVGDRRWRRLGRRVGARGTCHEESGHGQQQEHLPGMAPGGAVRRMVTGMTEHGIVG